MTREAVINNTYTDIKLSIEYFDLYIVRKAILNAIETNIPKFKGNLLDVGCGIMPYRELICEKNKQVTRYIGLDFENSISTEYALVKPDLFWKGKEIPLGNASIETIIATEFFEHSACPEDVMREMLRVLKPGGILFFTVPFLWFLHLVPYDEYRYTPFALKRILEKSGFSNIELYSLGGWDASFAQMITMWLAHRPLSKTKKKFLYPLLKLIVKKLIKTDYYLSDKDEFKDGNMITGIWGTSYKHE